jgi:hypothetical protein
MPGRPDLLVGSSSMQSSCNDPDGVLVFHASYAGQGALTSAGSVDRWCLNLSEASPMMWVRHERQE